jgi:hypothetical protein
MRPETAGAFACRAQAHAVRRQGAANLVAGHAAEGAGARPGAGAEDHGFCRRAHRPRRQASRPSVFLCIRQDDHRFALYGLTHALHSTTVAPCARLCLRRSRRASYSGRTGRAAGRCARQVPGHLPAGRCRQAEERRVGDRGAAYGRRECAPGGRPGRRAAPPGAWRAPPRYIGRRACDRRPDDRSPPHAAGVPRADLRTGRAVGARSHDVQALPWLATAAAARAAASASPR